MRSALSLLFVSSLALTFVACGDKGDDTGSDGDTDTDGTDTDTDTDGTDTDTDTDGTDTDTDTDTDTSGPVDADGDGYDETEDCDDTNAEIHPGADEVCNDVDDDCDDEIDEEATDATAWYADADGDGFGDPATETMACAAPEGMIADGTDCDDTAGSVFPGAAEVCNGIDDDCDSATGEEGTASWWDEDGSHADVTADLTGTSDTPAEVLIDGPGTMELCDGTWYANITIAADATLRSASGDPETTIIDGAATSSVVTVVGQRVATVEGLTLTNGSGGYLGIFESEGFGGGVACIGYDPKDPEAEADLTLTDVVLEDNYAGIFGGGGLALACSTTMTDVLIQNNASDSASGGWLGYGGDASLENVDILDNTSAVEIGGAFWLSLWGTQHELTLVDVRVEGNEAPTLGGIGWSQYDATWTEDDGESTCIQNVDDEFGGLLVNPLATMTAEGVDFGNDTDGTDNVPWDIFTGSRQAAYMAPSDGTVECDASYCGEAETTTIGSDASRGEVDLFGASVVLADDWRTLESFGIYAYAPPSDCLVDLYVLSNDSLDTTGWEIEWSSLGLTFIGDATVWGDSGDIGMITVPGMYYAIGAATDCGDAAAYYYDDGIEVGVTDVGFGTYEGAIYTAGYELLDADTTFGINLDDTSFYMQWDVTTL